MPRLHAERYDNSLYYNIVPDDIIYLYDCTRLLLQKKYILAHYVTHYVFTYGLVDLTATELVEFLLVHTEQI